MKNIFKNKFLITIIQLITFFILPYSLVWAQDSADYYESQYLRYEDFIYHQNIKTVLLSHPDFELSSPIIRFNTEDKLLLTFDDLDGDVKDYSYTFIHCNANWTPSDLLYSQYISGLPDDRITDYSFSFNTLQPYTHFRLLFPDNSVKPLISGNYLLLVFSEGNRNNIILTKRFMMADAKVNIEAAVHRASVIDDRNSKQKIDFSVFYNSYNIDNPFGDVNVVLMQNDRWDNAITTLKPLFLRSTQLDYTYESGNDFNGGNEYRTFDTRSLRFLSERVSKINTDSARNSVFIQPDESRSYQRYVTEYDLNGYYVVKTYDGRNDEIESDYVYVHFLLPYEVQRTDGNFYVFGTLSNNHCLPENKMIYDSEESSYKATLLLKQGYYNYIYVFLPDNSGAADETVIEGNHYETENDYTILVYHRPTASRYDHLVGIKKLNSMKTY
ncbi:MAG: DUF5103 domain-containing protein [Bacteroidia bacterium]|nr:DUF5103 domain-containing protein [Bacteroidia bacterium]